MPAARPLKRRASPSHEAVDPTLNHSFQVTFASPDSAPSDLPSVQPVQNSLGLQTTISFAPNVTPGTFTAPPSDDALLDGESVHPTLFPDASGIDESNLIPSAKRRRKTAPASASRGTPIPSKAATKKSGKNASSSRAASPAPDSKSPITANSTDAPAHIPRPPNAFILFRSSFIRSQHVSAETEGNHGTLSKIVGMLWHALSYEERQVWQAKARRAYAEHKRMYPGYSFRPTKDKASSNQKSEREGTPTDTLHARRKTRAVGPRDLERCEHIASLLARGLKGAELDAAVKEFDSVRAPQTFTPRFEAPITAQMYAASQSKDKGTKENQIKKEAEDLDEVKTRKSEEDTKGQATEKASQKTAQPAQSEERQTHLPPTTAHIPPRRVRRSSSAPILDASLSISAPAPLYPASSHANFFHSQTPGPFEYTHQQRNSIFGYDSVAQRGQDQQQSFTESFGYSQLGHDGSALRKRSASSSPPLRRPSYSYSHPQAQAQSFGHSFTPYPHQHEPQPFVQAYGAAHPHLQRMQAQVQAQSQAHVQNHQDGRSTEIGLGLDFDQRYQANYGAQQQQEGGGLSRQSTLTDISSDDGTNAPNTGGSGFWSGSVDFTGFSFTGSNGRETQTPISAHSSNPNPFDVPPLSAAPSSTTVDEIEYTYADMPGLVDAPPYQNFYQAPASSRTQHPHLEIQTSWTSEEFTFEHPPASAATMPPSSALDVDSVPPSAVDGSFDFPPPNSAVLNGYISYSTQSQSAPSSVPAPTPCSPASQSASNAPSSVGARTPIDDSFSTWDQSSVATATAAASPVNTYDSCSAAHADEEAVAREHALALQAGFRTYLAHAEKIGALESGAAAGATFEQFVRFVRQQQKISGGANISIGIGDGGELKGMSGFSVRMPEPHTQMAHVM